MARLRWTRRGRWLDNRRGVDVTGAGVYQVPDGAVEEYLDHPSDGWQRVDDSEAESQDGDEDEDEDDTDAEAFDVDAFLDRTPMADVVDDIAAGDADGHLDAVASAADRKGVQDAVDDRRDTLEEA